MQWVTGVRVRHAHQLLETTTLGVERIGQGGRIRFGGELP